MVLLDKAATVLPFAGAAAVAAIAYFFARLVARRRFYRNVPCPPHSFLWGHLKLIGEYMARMPKGGYISQAITQIKLDHDLPDVFYLDMWPVVDSFLCLGGPEAAAYPTTANPWPLPSVVGEFLIPATGDGFIEVTNGPLWKELLHRLAPGLTPNVIKTYFPTIVDAACDLRDVLASKSGDNHPAIRMQDVTGRYPFDVISEVLFGQGLGDEIYQQVVILSQLHLLEQEKQSSFRAPWDKWEASRNWSACLRVIETELLRLIRARFAELQKDKTAATQRLMDRMLLPRVKEGLPLDKALEELCLSNAKGLILAGYGTTSDTTTYIWLLLQSHPEILEKLRDEHDRVFGKDLDATVTKLRENPGILKSLEYTTAVIHETMRLYPIGMVVRKAPADVKSITISGTEYPTLPDQMTAIIAHVMHYNDDFFPDAKRFLPDRFLNDTAASALAVDDEDDETTSSTTTTKAAKDKSQPSYPRNAYRPFERGPRACIGQALAMEEMKVQLVVLARSFDMQLELGEGWNGEDKSEAAVKAFKPTFAHTDMEEKIGRHALQVAGFTAAPAGPVMVKVRPAVR